MSKRLVIVESPTKAKTISKFLSKDYEVTASYGHVRDLPNSAAEIPEDIKKEKWSRLGINVESNFEPLYIIPDSKKKRVQELKKLLKGCSELLLATDEDREGESISWHLLDVLKPKITVKRLVFHEITKSAIQKSLENPRDIDENLVRAQETRRLIDRLYGYSVSPLLWKKMAPRLSAGRVQSVAMRLLVERERERQRFIKSYYWDLTAILSKGTEGSFQAELSQVDGERIASGKDFEPTTGKLKAGISGVKLLDETKARELEASIRGEKVTVNSVEEKPFTSKPYPPFTTSTLQQEGSRKLRFPARHTMSVAQTLYENGFITYMRTDSTSIATEGISAARDLIAKEFGKEYLPTEPRIYKTKVKNAQEAHEAIRPAGEQFASPDEVKSKLGLEAGKLYELIYRRTLACQMEDARGLRVSVQMNVKNATFRASGRTIQFPGFLLAYVEDTDDPEAELADKETVLPPLKVGDILDIEKLNVLDHETQAPPRYTEGSLIKQLEKLGIGRPSTWATIVDVVLNRSYAFKRGPALVPTFLAAAVTGMLEGHFNQLMDYQFTANLEDDLDAIARGEKDSLSYLNRFYLGNGHPGLKQLVDTGEEQIDPRIVCGVPVGVGANGEQLEVRIGRYGPFLSNGEDRASLPEDLAPDELSIEKATELLEVAKKGPESLGDHPELKLPVYLKNGRFGPYVQLGEQGEEKPKMASLLPGMSPTDVTLEIAIKLLELPRTLGKHPENGEEIIAANGRYGPYIKCGSDTRSIPADSALSPITITLEDALKILSEPKQTRRQAATPKSLKQLGKHPVTEKEVTVRSGRFGPYVTDGEINASLPRGKDPESLSMEEAVELLLARAAKIAADGGVKPSKRGQAKSKKAATKKASPKKEATKKETTKKAEKVTKETKKKPATPKKNAKKK